MLASKRWFAALMFMVIPLVVIGCSGKSSIPVLDKVSTSTPVGIEKYDFNSKSQDALGENESDSLPLVSPVPTQEEQASESIRPAYNGGREDTSTPVTELESADSKVKARIDQSFEVRFNSLRSECKASGEQLIASIFNELNGKEEVSLSQLQSKYIGKVAKAEAACDAKFASLLGQAKAEYTKNDLPVVEMPAWKTDYEKEKASMRLSAAGKLLKAYQNSKGASESE
ncbi:hypothetical protein D3H35_06785 [Cohnella faecalis]|uniref:Uncharacterized protein n=2 Tax=Cohnella faecalis TaxID=2315694 RepID=A0A398CQ25_9BACL|nr:hypothetical protein D3H35_06785 [Cohnella faecalis]